LLEYKEHHGVEGGFPTKHDDGWGFKVRELRLVKVIRLRVYI
jgi:hypothetical protein